MLQDCESPAPTTPMQCGRCLTLWDTPPLAAHTLTIHQSTAPRFRFTATKVSRHSSNKRVSPAWLPPEVRRPSRCATEICERGDANVPSTSSSALDLLCACHRVDVLWRFLRDAPTITAQPQDQKVGVGGMATFSVTATGSMSLSYQWMENGMTIAGATSASYTTPPVALADNHSTFAVVVSNQSGSATSSAATLTVLAAP